MRKVRDGEDTIASTRDACAPETHPSRELFAETHSAQTKKQIRHHNKY